MSDASEYRDLNQDLYRRHWHAGWSWDAYLASSEPVHRERWLAALERTHLTDTQTARLGGFGRQINLLVLSGVWCGDCVRQGPIFYRLANAAPRLELRFLDRDQHPELADLLRINGARKVPVALFLSEDCFEVARFGDRPLSVYRAKAAREVGASCETGLVPPAADALATEVAEWVDLTEWVHLILRTAPLLRRRYGD